MVRNLLIYYSMSDNKDGVFHLNAAEVSPILFYDENEKGNALPLDDRDINFLENDVNYVGSQMEFATESSSMTH